MTFLTGRKSFKVTSHNELAPVTGWRYFCHIPEAFSVVKMIGCGMLKHFHSICWLGHLNSISTKRETNIFQVTTMMGS